VVHAATAEHPFISLALLKDRNFVAGLVLIFSVGIILYATLALLPPMLQTLMNFPVITIGEMLAPRGIGTLFAMLLVGRIVGRIDTRLIILFGLSLTTLSLWEMTGYSLEMDLWPIVSAGITQGFGLGFIFVPLSAVAFATLAPRLRTEAAALFSLVRNAGGSIGISVVVNLVAQNTQVNHASIAAHVTPFNEMFRLPAVQQVWDLQTTPGLVALDGEINRQAAMVAYIDDFKFMMIVTLLTIPLVLLLRTQGRSIGTPSAPLD
jgi:DHA2 family multidrug resistance protein